MTLRRTFTALLLCAAVSTTTIAAPPEKEGGKGGGKGGNGDAAEFAPEILYQYNGRKSQDLRLTGIDGQSYVTVHSAPSAQLDGFTASDEQDALIAYAEYGDLYLTSWTTSPVAIGAKTLISARQSRGSGAGRIAWMDFSPSGDRLAFSESSSEPNNLASNDSRRLWIYDLTTSNLSLVLSNFSVMDVHWSPRSGEGNVVYFSGGTVGVEYPEHIYRFDLSNGDITPVLNYGEHFTSPYFDVTGIYASGTAKFAVSHKGADSRDYIRVYDLSGNRVHGNWVARGDILSFDCSGTMLIHKDEGATGANLTITNVGGGASAFLSGRGVHSVSDWMPRNPC